MDRLEICEEIERGDDWAGWDSEVFRTMRCAVFRRTGFILMCFRGVGQEGRCQHLWLTEAEADYFGGPAKEALNFFRAEAKKAFTVSKEDPKQRSARAKTLVDGLMAEIFPKGKAKGIRQKRKSGKRR